MPPGIGPDDNYSDKVVHFFLFGIFFSLLLFYLEEKKTCTNIKKYLYSFLLSCVYAGACELIQHFIPGRTASYYDFIAGVLGAFVFLLIIYGYERKR
jgi:VanZ family protein